MSERVRIVPYAPEHHDAVAALVLGIQRGEFGADIAYDDQPDLQDPQGFFAARGGAFWVALLEGAVVGTGAVLPFGDRNGAVRKMFVRADARGPEHRIAHKLLDAIIAFARAKGMTALYLDTAHAFAAAHRFYTKRGFTEIARGDTPAGFPAMAEDAKFFMTRL
jgi:N-acetylglutamate synthase-like GNAT family acetyltransferase